jgi:hypothetical protein
MPRYLFIVSRDQPALYEFAKQRFANDDQIEVIMDRRTSRGPPPHREERRRQPDLSDELRVYSYVLVKPG